MTEGLRVQTEGEDYGLLCVKQDVLFKVFNNVQDRDCCDWYPSHVVCDISKDMKNSKLDFQIYLWC